MKRKVKINPQEWKALANEKITISPKGLLWLRSSEAFKLFVIDEDGVEVFHSKAESVQIAAQEEIAFVVQGVPDAPVLIYAPQKMTFEDIELPIFTNANKQPLQSGHSFEISKQLRLFELELARKKQEAFAEIQGMRRLVKIDTAPPQDNSIENTDEQEAGA